VSDRHGYGEWEALRELVHRLRLVRYDGNWVTGSGASVPQFTDQGMPGRETSFVIQKGETIGEALDRVDARYRAGALMERRG
jgi:hypothetical protein